jgi:hypothetical protein
LFWSTVGSEEGEEPIPVAETWEIAGDYFEACNCEVACPCVFLGPPTTDECTLLVAWHISRGQFDRTRLNNLNVARAVHTPGAMTQVKWKAALYLDERAGKAQREALTKIFGGQAGGHFAAIAALIGEVLGVKSARIEIESAGRRRAVRVGGVAQAEIEGLRGPGGEEPTIHGLLLYGAADAPAVVARSKKMTFKDYGFSWNLSGKNGFISAFSYKGP